MFDIYHCLHYLKLQKKEIKLTISLTKTNVKHQFMIKLLKFHILYQSKCSSRIFFFTYFNKMLNIKTVSLYSKTIKITSMWRKPDSVPFSLSLSVAGLLIVVGTFILGKLSISRKWLKASPQPQNSQCFQTCSGNPKRTCLTVRVQILARI